MNLFNCNNAKIIKDNTIMLMVENIRIIYEINFSLGMVQDITLKSTNYTSFCKITFDTRKGRIIRLECKNFNAEKVKIILEQCFKEQGIQVMNI